MNKTIILFIFMPILGLFSGCSGKSSIPENYSKQNKNKDKDKEISCAEGSFFDNESKECIKKCQSGEIFDSNIKKCVPVIGSTPAGPEIIKFKCEGNSYQIDSTKRECVPGFPLFMFKKEYSILDAWEGNKPITVCIDVDDSTRAIITNSDFLLVASKIKYSLHTWLKPLVDGNFPVLNFSKEVKIYKNINYECNPKNWNTTVHISSDQTLIKKCKQPGACASPWSGEVWVSLEEEIPAYIHEFGHIFGFEDHYIYNGNRFCKNGYDTNTTVMCKEQDHLKPADIEGVKRQYCRFWPETEVCQRNEVVKLTDIENGPMITCFIGRIEQSISIVNNYKDVSVRLYKAFNGEKIKEFENVNLSNKLNSFPWVFQSQNGEKGMRFEINWINKQALFEFGTDDDRKVIEFHFDENNEDTSTGFDRGRCQIHDPSLALRIKKEFSSL